MKMMALKGNRTNTGGYVLDGDQTCLDNGQPTARHMGLASCERCEKTGPMFGTANSFGIGNARGVLDGDIVMCDCPQGTNRVIARSTVFYRE
jgi:uncharacterized Zn-binding protein involved in type VI secretion